MEKKKKVRITPERQEVIDRMRGGALVMVTYNPGQLPHLSFSDGAECNQGVVDRMIKNKMLVADDQGLIADMPQCYKLNDI